MEIPEGYTPLHDDAGNVIGSYGKISGPVIVQLANREATDVEKTQFKDRVRQELSNFLEPNHSILFE